MEMVQNGKGTTAKGGFYQKDEFHIIQEITRDVPEKYRNLVTELINKKEYGKIKSVINGVRYELGANIRQ